MSKNLRTYVLLALVLILWGIIGFKVIGTLSPEPQPEIVVKRTSQDLKSVKKRDTFSLIADYRDPFLGTLPPRKKKTGKRPVAKKEMPKKNIVYSGLVSQTGSGSTLFFISIDGRQYTLSKNEEVDNVRLLRGNEENIRVRYNGITETIARAE
ncbi:hypothetical protein [Flagellimonas marina]|uniref:Type II secretion system protein GspC N-terminal domain-containing protein n=1 Tax=Flagellimonas marina TaxID=1775168 RepID=A0ABV8PPG3_9FLAO